MTHPLFNLFFKLEIYMELFFFDNLKNLVIIIFIFILFKNLFVIIIFFIKRHQNIKYSYINKYNFY